MKIVGDLALALGELIQTRVENLGALPAAGNVGRIIFLTTTSSLYIDNGASFQQMDSGALSRLTAFNGPAGLAVGDAVNVSASDTLVKADATLPTTFAFGVVVGLISATVYLIGVSDVELGGFSALSSGLQVYLDTTPGLVTQTAPAAVGTIVQLVGIARNTTTIAFNVSHDFTVN